MKTLTDLSVEFALETTERFVRELAFAEAFTERYRALAGATLEEREQQLLDLQFRRIFQPPETGDLFVGRVTYGLVGLSPEPMGLGFYCHDEAWRAGATKYPEHAERVEDLLGYWAHRTTQAKTRQAYPEVVARFLPSDQWDEDSGVAFPLYRLAGSNLDYGTLLSLGLDGLEESAADSPFRFVVPLLRRTIDWYRDHCDGEMADTLPAIRHEPPRNFRQAIQLLWLYALHAGTWSYGRLDVVLGPFLDDSISDETALAYLCSFWRLMRSYENQYNNRGIVGGRGRPNDAEADRFALLAIEATRRVRLNQPQLSLRFHDAQNPELMDRALDALGEGCTFPILYNDDVNIPAVAKSFRVEESMAENYTPYGCGEYVLGHYGAGSPNGIINLLKALEVALHGGVDPATGNEVADVPPLDSLTSFEDVWNNYRRVTDPLMAALAQQENIGYEVAGREAPFSFISLLTADCLDRGCGAFSGGVRFLGGTVETYGNTNVADSLLAIDELVFRRRETTLPDLVRALDDNFVGHERLLALCRAVPKYGNDHDAADSMAVRVHEHICAVARDQAQAHGLHSYQVVIINNWANTILGRHTGASAEGRLAGQPLANANNPSPGADRSGPRAFLSSLVHLDPGIHAGAVQNMKFDRSWFGPQRPKMEALLRTYFDQGGTQAMITVVSRDDLESAMMDPQNWGHLLVRVGGFSARFIDLPSDAQHEVLQRTLN